MIKAFKFRAQAIFSLLEKTHTPGSQNKYPKKLYTSKTGYYYSCFANLRAISNLCSFFLYTLYFYIAMSSANIVSIFNLLSEDNITYL